MVALSCRTYVVEIVHHDLAAAAGFGFCDGRANAVPFGVTTVGVFCAHLSGATRTLAVEFDADTALVVCTTIPPAGGGAAVRWYEAYADVIPLGVTAVGVCIANRRGAT